MKELVRTVMRMVLQTCQQQSIVGGCSGDLHDQEMANEQEEHKQPPSEPVVCRPPIRVSQHHDTSFKTLSSNLHIPGSWREAHQQLEDLECHFSSVVGIVGQDEEDVEAAAHDQHQNKYGHQVHSHESERYQ